MSLTQQLAATGSSFILRFGDSVWTDHFAVNGIGAMLILWQRIWR
jgi:hypothetical protein